MVLANCAPRRRDRGRSSRGSRGPGRRAAPLAVVNSEGVKLVHRFAKSADCGIVRQLRAWLAFERASAHWYVGNYLGTLTSLLCSWVLAPRRRVYLRRFWRIQL